MKRKAPRKRARIKQDPLDGVVDAGDVAERLGVRLEYARQLIRAGTIPGRRAVGGWITTPDALASYKPDGRRPRSGANGG